MKHDTQTHTLTREQVKRIAAEVAEIIGNVQLREEGFLSDAKIARIVREVFDRHTQGGRI